MTLYYFQNEFINTNVCYYVRNKEELSVPFTDSMSPVYKAGLRLLSIQIKVSSCPYHAKWTSEGTPGRFCMH